MLGEKTEARKGSEDDRRVIGHPGWSREGYPEDNRISNLNNLRELG